MHPNDERVISNFIVQALKNNTSDGVKQPAVMPRMILWGRSEALRKQEIALMRFKNWNCRIIDRQGMSVAEIDDDTVSGRVHQRFQF